MESKYFQGFIGTKMDMNEHGESNKRDKIYKKENQEKIIELRNIIFHNSEIK
jgi:hypothetical protein